MIYAAIGVLVLAVIVVAVQKCRLKRLCTKDNSTGAPLLDISNYSIMLADNKLVNHPHILKNRIPYNAIEVTECVSLGGFGVVYSGVYKKRKVAVKKIRAEYNRDIARVESFLREICMIANLEHPRIVSFIGVAWDSLHNLSAVTEFMDQGDLRDVLQSHKDSDQPLTWESHKARIALHIAEALVYLHSLTPTVIHRDLKSKNVLLNSDLDAKLSDFGISRESTVDDTHWTVGIGTSFWIAPEVLLGKKYDARVDVFSFGIVLSEIDTNDYPYWNATDCEGLGKTAILQLVAAGQVRPKFTDECPKRILELAERCLQGDPQNRPSSAEVVEMLKDFLGVAGSRESGSASGSKSPSL